MNDLKESVAVVTGGASGIGYALAKGAQARGAKVVIADIREAALTRAAYYTRGYLLSFSW